MSPPDPSARDASSRPRSPAQARDRLARAALELFTTRGYHATTTPLIAARANVAEGTIYRHFLSKDDLLNEVFRAAVRAFQEPLKSLDPMQRCQERLDATARSWLALAKRNPPLVRLVFDPSLTRLLDDRSRAALRELRGHVEQTIAVGKAAGQVRRGSADLWADVWIRLIQLALDRVAAGQWQPEDEGAGHVRQAAWDAIRTGMPTGSDTATIQNPASGELP